VSSGKTHQSFDDRWRNFSAWLVILTTPDYAKLSRQGQGKFSIFSENIYFFMPRA